MTTTATTQFDERMEGGYKPMPLWLSIPLLLICLFVGGFIIRWYMNSGAMVKETSILGVVPPDGFRRYVKPTDDKNPVNWNARTETADAEFKVDKGTSSLVSVRLINGNRGGGNGWTRYPAYIPDATRRILEGAAAASNSKKLAGTDLDKATLDLLKAQTSQRNDSNIQPGDSDKARLLADFKDFLAASDDVRVTAEIKLLATLDDVAKADEEVVKQNAEAKVAAIKKVLTPEQMAALPAMAGGGGGQGRPAGGGGQRQRPTP